jgi:hypothetical protein
MWFWGGKIRLKCKYAAIAAEKLAQMNRSNMRQPRVEEQESAVLGTELSDNSDEKETA